MEKRIDGRFLENFVAFQSTAEYFLGLRLFSGQLDGRLYELIRKCLLEWVRIIVMVAMAFFPAFIGIGALSVAISERKWKPFWEAAVLLLIAYLLLYSAFTGTPVPGAFKI